MKKQAKQIKSAKENLLDTLTAKKILFIENDTSLNNGLDEVEKFFKANKIKYKCLFDVGDKTILKVEKAIAAADIIIFQTTWLREISHILFTYFTKTLKDKKIIIECYISEPSWYYKPTSVANHDVYILKPSNEDMKIWGVPWKFYKLHKDKPYWNFKNNFDA